MIKSIEGLTDAELELVAGGMIGDVCHNDKVQLRLGDACWNPLPPDPPAKTLGQIYQDWANLGKSFGGKA